MEIVASTVRVRKNTLTPPLTCASFTPVSDQAPGAVPLPNPDPHQDQASTRITRLLGVIHSLIAFGKHLTTVLQSQPSNDTLYAIVIRFGTTKFALIVARIAHAIRLAEALEAKLAPLADRPERQPAAPTQRASSPRKPRDPRNAAPPPADAESILAGLPTAEQIAEQLRTRPAHAVLLEIFSNLGILPSDPLWRDIVSAFEDIGGSFLKLWNDIRERTKITNFYPPGTPIRFPKVLTNSEIWERRYATAEAATGPP